MSSRGSMRELSWPSWEVTIVPGLAQKTRGELRLGKFSWGPALGSWFWEVQLRAAGPSLLQHAFDFRVTPRMDEIDILASSLTLANQREQEARLFTKFQMMPASLVENRSFCDVCTLCCALSQKPFFLQGDFSPAFVCFVKVDDRPSSSQSDRDPSRLAQVTTLSLLLGQSGNLCRGHLLVPQTVCRWEVHDIHTCHSCWMNQLFVALIFLTLYRGTHVFETYSSWDRNSWGWLLNSLTRTEERTVEEKSRVEETIYRRVEKRIELKSRSD